MLGFGVPDCTRHWTTLFYGPRGSCKTLHQAREMRALLRYFDKRYRKRPLVPRAIVVTNQKVCKEMEDLYLKKELFYFDDNDLETLRYCPRERCWKGPEKHKLHGAYLFIDDVSNMLPATDWASTPMWLKKMLIKGRKYGVHVVATLVDPFDLVIQVRRCTDMAYKFSPIWKTRDPDETQPPLRWVFGWYRKRRVSGEMLWKFGDLPEQAIRVQFVKEEELHDHLRQIDKAHAIVYDDTWAGRIHFFNRTGRFLFLNVSSTSIYDTLQDIAPDD